MDTKETKPEGVRKTEDLEADLVAFVTATKHRKEIVCSFTKSNKEE